VSALSNWVEPYSSRPKSWLGDQPNVAGRTEDVDSGQRRRNSRAVAEAMVTSSSGANGLVDAWLDGNRQAVEANNFFSFAIEPDAMANITPARKERRWMPRQVIHH
jgi:hypothetical protein